MIDARALFTVAASELRRTRRLIRYWVFVVLAFLIPVGSFLWHGLGVHRNVSTLASSFAMINPRFFVSSYGLTFLLVYMLGVVFLAFDVRSRDVRSGVSEVLDARPVGNVELIGGRWLGLLFASWCPLLVLVVLLELVGLAVGVTLEPRSLVVLLTIQAIPSLALVVAAVYFVTLLVRHRLVAALILLGLWAAGFATISGWIPITLAQAPMVDLTGWTVSPFPSDLTSALPDAAAWMHRTGAMLLALGLLVLAAVVHPRADGGPRGLRVGAGLAAVLAAAALTGAPYARNARQVERFESYQRAHAERATPATLDLTRVEGTAAIDPGRDLSLDLVLTLVPAGGEAVSELLLTLNPGVRVEALERDGAPLVHELADGLVSAALSPPVSPGETLRVRLKGRGRPDPAFGYLDASRHALEMPIDSGAVFLFGFEPFVFERGYVALMPGAHWLPSAGTALTPGGTAPPADPFTVDLEVALPAGWSVAGPGRPRPAAQEAARLQRVRFAPPAPVQRVALVASEFDVSEAEAAGVSLRLMLHPSHAENLEPLSEAGPVLVERIEGKLEEAARIGLPYPYEGLTMVEVPNMLRGYAGGWRQDTTLAQPGLVLVRESGLPTARWDVRFGDGFEAPDREGGKPAALADAVQRFFAGDIGGGNPQACAARSFFDFTVGWEGPEAPAVGFVAETLASWLLTEERTYFSARMFERNEFQEMIETLLVEFFGSGSRSLNEAMLRQLRSRPSVWNAVEGAPLARLRVEEEPQQALDALVLKGGALVRSLSEAFDREALGRLLGEVRERYSGRSLSRAELEATAEELGIPLARWLGLWLDSLEAPAFAAEGARVRRLEDAEDGTPRYQHVVRLRNDGGVAGVVVLESAFQSDGGSSRRSSDPYVVEAEQEVEIGLVHQDRAERIEVQPFFARNRGPFSLEPVVEDGEEAAAGEPWDGMRPVPYGRPADGTVVVDDLDPGFETEQEQGESWARIGSTAPEQRDLDHGLPVQTRGRAPRQWTRLATMGSWGLYRHTTAVAYTSDPSTRARFSGELPEAGPWYLEIHRPEGLEFRMYGYDRLSWAEVSLSIEGNGTSREASWDASAAPYGWARVGRFEMPAGAFAVTMAPAGEEDGLIAADAIRWVPARAGENR